MKTEPIEALKYRAKICSSPIGETGDYDSWIELVTPDFNLQCYDPCVDFEQVEEIANLLNKATSNPKIKQLEWDFHGLYYQAQMPIACYVIHPSYTDDHLCVLDINDIPVKFNITLDEAKAAAQADFEKRIKECLL